MSLHNRRLLFERVGRKTRRNVTLSAELNAVLDEELGHRELSAFVEVAVWERLAREHGVDDLRGAIETAQDELDDDERLSEPKPVEIEV